MVWAGNPCVDRFCKAPLLGAYKDQESLFMPTVKGQMWSLHSSVLIDYVVYYVNSRVPCPREEPDITHGEEGRPAENTAT